MLFQRLLCASALFCLAGCEPLSIMGAGALVGSSVAEERGVGGALSDAGIRAKINLLWFEFNPTLSEEVELSVREGRVLLAGNVSSVQIQIDAVRLAWQVSGVKEVRDETQVSEGKGIRGYASDTWITMQLRSDILFDSEIESINYSVKTVDGVVFLMGVGQNREEVERVIKHARSISGVKKVMSYVRLKDELTPAASPELFQKTENIRTNIPQGSVPADQPYDPDIQMNSSQGGQYLAPQPIQGQPI